MSIVWTWDQQHGLVGPAWLTHMNSLLSVDKIAIRCSGHSLVNVKMHSSCNLII